jgi:DNA end-binding protein Ku
MVAARANWKGFIKFGEVAVAVALYTAASSSERIAFHTINRATGNRVHREFIDSETSELVERDEQVKGYEVENGEYVVLEPEEVAAAVPDSDKTLKIEAFVPCSEIDDAYFDKPYYLTPDKMGADAPAGRHAPGQGCSAGAYRPLPPAAHSADPPSWRRPDRHDAELLL